MNFANLVRYARENPALLPPPCYRIRTIDWVMDIRQDGITLESCGERDAVPLMRRSGRGAMPLLAVDTAAYVLGRSGDGVTEQQANVRAGAFWAQMSSWLISEWSHTAVAAALTLVQIHGTATSTQAVPARDTVAIRVEGIWLHRLPEAVAQWAHLVGVAKGGATGLCTACGQVTALATSLPNSIPGRLIPGLGREGQLTVLPLSERQGTATLPLCVTCGDICAAVLEVLLADPRHRIRMDGQDSSMVAFGLGAGADDEVVGLLRCLVDGRVPA